MAASLALAVLLAAAPEASAEARMAWAPYRWVQRATLIVEGRVESVGEHVGTLRVTKTLHGEALRGTIAFAPVTHPMCKSGRIDPFPPDVVVGDEVALFLTKNAAGAYEVVDLGFAKVQLGARREMFNAPAASVERLVAAMTAADADARERAMIEASTADEQFLRRAAGQYVRDDLGVTDVPEGRESWRWEKRTPQFAAHRDAVRRHAASLAAVVRRENGEEPCAAALGALADAGCAPEGAFDAILAYARTVRNLGQLSYGEACRVLALYDRADALDAVIELSSSNRSLIATLGTSPRPEARARLLADFEGTDARRATTAAQGLGDLLERRADETVVRALLARLAGRSDHDLDATICAALMHVRGADVAALLLDELASETLTAARGELCATTLHSYDAAVPPIAGVRELLLKRQDALIRRLDSGVAVSVRLVYILQDLRTPEAKAALRRAAKSSPVPQVRSQAKSWVEWNDR